VILKKQKSAMKNCWKKSSELTVFFKNNWLFPAIKAVWKCRKALQQRFAQYQQGNILVELGYNNLLHAKANTYFDQALERIKKNPKKCTE
jgi:hypothetical protein